jgi:hypothetical protein
MPPEEIQGALDVIDLGFDVRTHGESQFLINSAPYLGDGGPAGKIAIFPYE